MEKKQEQRKFSLSNSEQDKKKVKSAGKKEKMAQGNKKKAILEN